MGFGKFTLLLLLVIVAGALAVMALPGGRVSLNSAELQQHPWKRFSSSAGGGFDVPAGWLAYDPFTRVALENSVGGCQHVPPRNCRAAYLRSPEQRVELFLALGPVRRLDSLLPVVGPEAPEATDPLATLMALTASPAGPAGRALAWSSWNPIGSKDPEAALCLVGSCRSGPELFVVHLRGRPSGDDLQRIADLLESVQLPGS